MNEESTSFKGIEETVELTSLDGDGVAKVGAVQLPGDAQLPQWQIKVVLLAGLALEHCKLLAIQAHCTGVALSVLVPCSVCFHIDFGRDHTCICARV